LAIRLNLHRQIRSSEHGPLGCNEGSHPSFPKKRHIPEEILRHLRVIELETGKVLAVFEACRKLGINEETYFTLEERVCGLRVDQAMRMKTPEQENLGLKRIVANPTLDLLVLTEGAQGHC
jgi:hypothetical protein